MSDTRTLRAALAALDAEMAIRPPGSPGSNATHLALRVADEARALLDAYVRLYRDVAACGAPEGTQVDDVLATHQDTYTGACVECGDDDAREGYDVCGDCQEGGES